MIHKLIRQDSGLQWHCIHLTDIVVHGIDPITEFEDTVSDYLESIESANENNEARKHLSGSQLKQLGRTVQDLSKQGLLVEVQIDTLSMLLKHLESAMNEFVTTDIISMFSEEFITAGDGWFNVIGRLFDKITSTLEHVVLSLAILNARGLQQHLFPEELLVASLSVFKTHAEKFLVPALEFSEDDNGLSKGSGIFKAISGNPALRSRVLSVVGTTCDISERLRRSGNTEVSDDIIVKLVYIGLALFFIDTSSESMVGLTEAESVKQSGSNLLRMVSFRSVALLFFRYHNLLATSSNSKSHSFVLDFCKILKAKDMDSGGNPVVAHQVTSREESDEGIQASRRLKDPHLLRLTDAVGPDMCRESSQC